MLHFLFAFFLKISETPVKVFFSVFNGLSYQPIKIFSKISLHRHFKDVRDRKILLKCCPTQCLFINSLGTIIALVIAFVFLINAV